MANPIIRGFSKLTQFSGRDTRGEFWPYVGAVIALVFIVQAIGMSVVMADFMSEVEAHIEAQPLLLIDPSLPPNTVARVETAPPMPDFRILGAVMGGTLVMAISLLAAAVSRRLHDRDKTAIWGLLPVPFVAVAAIGFPIMMIDMMAGTVPDFGLFGLLFINNVAYLAALVTLIIMLALPGSPRANRHGEAKTAAPIRPVDDWSTSS